MKAPVKSHKRTTKSGKVTTVKSHSKSCGSKKGCGSSKNKGKEMEAVKAKKSCKK
jgi:hypothetical protein